MIILIVLITIIVVGHLLERNDYFTGSILMIVGYGLLFLALLTLALNRMDVYAQEKKLLAFKESIRVARANGVGNIENAAILTKIAEWNEFLAEMKYYNNTIVDIWIPDSVSEQQPIK